MGLSLVELPEYTHSIHANGWKRHDQPVYIDPESITAVRCFEDGIQRPRGTDMDQTVMIKLYEYILKCGSVFVSDVWIGDISDVTIIKRGGQQ